jgi:hypothetical protein
MTFKRIGAIVLPALLVAATLPAVAADINPEAYYKDKTVELVVGTASGGAFDRTARIIAQVLPEHFPGHPKVVVQNRPGGGGLTAIRYVLQGKADGLSVTTVNPVRSVAPFLWGDKTQGIDPFKDKWIGMPIFDDLPNAIYIRRDVARNWDDVLKLGRPLKIPAQNPTSAGRGQVGPLLIEMQGGPVKMIYGYDGGAAEYMAAMDRGEVDGTSSANERNVPAVFPQWIPKHFINPVFWYGAKPDEDFLKKLDAPMPPNIKEIVKAPDAMWQAFDSVMIFHKTSRAFVMHANTPAPIYDAWKKAFKGAIEDPKYTDLMLKAGDNPAYGAPEEMENMLKVVNGLPPDALAAFRKLVGEDG